jgi:subtilase family serine protease
MKKLFRLLAVASLASVLLLAQNPRSNGIGNAWGYGNGNGANDGIVAIPDSSVENPSDAGHKAHTNHLVFLRGQGKQSFKSELTPADIRMAYNLDGLGGKGIIAIVDAYHYDKAWEHLNTFHGSYIGPPGSSFPKCDSVTSGTACFWQVYADSKGNPTTQAPPVNCGWNQEAALDIEWAHAMAPNASIVLVEAQSNSNADLFSAVQLAAGIVAAKVPVPSVAGSVANANGGQVSMSWGGSEYAGEVNWDSVFQQSKAIFIAASGDSGGKTIYPSASPWVIAAGGTTLNITTGTSPTVTETGWSGSGGGSSRYERRLGGTSDYQYSVAGTVGTQRGVPDLSFDADPTTGVSVYGPTCQGTNTGWMIFGGTSVSAPALAGIINSAAALNGLAASTNDELWRIYKLPTTAYRDITSGKAGSFTAGSGWDFVTGVGTPRTLNGK